MCRMEEGVQNSVLTARSFLGKTVGTTHATVCESKGEPQCGHIPAPILGDNAQREDRASTISNQRADKTAQSSDRPALPTGTGDPDQSYRRLRGHDPNHDVCCLQGGPGTSKVAARRR